MIREAIPEDELLLLHPKISGGATALPGEFPHQVQLLYNNQHFCGGSIISPILILTAAHCLLHLRADALRVVAGEYHRLASDGTEQYRRIRSLTLHERYNRRTHEHDIGLVELDTPLIFNIYVNSILIPNSSTRLNKTAVTSGWGSVPEINNQLAVILRKVTIQLHSKGYCSRQWRETFRLGMICGGWGNKDSCGGDSGGPVTCEHLTFPGKKFVCGITSFGVKDCGNPQYPGVYTDVSFYHDWILSQTRLSVRQMSCPGHYFRCNTIPLCVPRSSLCDTFHDCQDGSDETPSMCSPTTFRCSSGEIIRSTYRCDRIVDCRDGSDEANCNPSFSSNNVVTNEFIIQSPRLPVKNP